MVLIHFIKMRNDYWTFIIKLVQTPQGDGHGQYMYEETFRNFKNNNDIKIQYCAKKHTSEVHYFWFYLIKITKCYSLLISDQG